MIINLLGEELSNEPCYQLVNDGEVVSAYQDGESAKSGSSCGANGPGGGGFQPGNTCGKEDGAGEAQGEAGKPNPKVLEWARKKFGSDEVAENFARWFGDSKVVDEDGNPLVVYHGTNTGFQEFRESTNAHAQQLGVPVHFFTPDADLAGAYAASSSLSGGDEQIMPVMLKMERPLVIEANGRDWQDVLSEVADKVETWRTPEEREFKEYRMELGEKYAYENEFEPEFEIPKAEQDKFDRLNSKFEEQLTNRKHPIHKTKPQGVVGYDGMIVRAVLDRPPVEHDETVSYNPFADIYSVFSPTQIKSATGNSGKFDPDSGDITKAAPSPKQSRKKSARKPAKGGTMWRKKGS